MAVSTDGVGVGHLLCWLRSLHVRFHCLHNFCFQWSSLRTKMIWRKIIFQCRNIKWMQPEEDKKSWTLSSPNNCHLYLPYIGLSTILSVHKHACILFFTEMISYRGHGEEWSRGAISLFQATKKKKKREKWYHRAHTTLFTGRTES